MGNITIGRYAPESAKDLATGRGFSAWIEGTDDAGQSWILWLDETGRPVQYHAHRMPDGAVIEPCIDLIDPPFRWPETDDVTAPAAVSGPDAEPSL